MTSTVGRPLPATAVTSRRSRGAVTRVALSPYSDAVDLMPLVATSGWASGINAYAVIVVMGLLGRFADVDVVPESLQSNTVLAIAGAMFAVEFITDKIPYVDSAWDGLSTLVRPTIGAMLGFLVAGDAESVNQALYAATGGGAALASHLVKAGNRLAINASPEPFTNIGVSLGEDVAVVGVIALAVYQPWLALAIASFFFLVGLALMIVLFSLVRRGWRRWRARQAARA